MQLCSGIQEEKFGVVELINTAIARLKREYFDLGGILKCYLPDHIEYFYI